MHSERGLVAWKRAQHTQWGGAANRATVALATDHGKSFTSSVLDIGVPLGHTDPHAVCVHLTVRRLHWHDRNKSEPIPPPALAQTPADPQGFGQDQRVYLFVVACAFLITGAALFFMASLTPW